MVGVVGRIELQKWRRDDGLRCAEARGASKSKACNFGACRGQCLGLSWGRHGAGLQRMTVCCGWAEGPGSIYSDCG